VTLNDLRTPAVLIDRFRALRNLDRMQTAASARGIRMRPHAKTHKSPIVARWQIERGAAGICCAKIGEAEVFADAGISDIRIPYPLNPANADRLIALAQRVRLSFIVDHPGVAEAWSRALHAAAVAVDVLVKIDVGFHRCGIDPHAPDAADFVAGVAALPGLNFRGLLSHAGHAYGASSESEAAAFAATEAQMLTTLAEEVRRKGVEVAEVSVGATPTVRFSLELSGLTEVRPGNYIYFDRTQVGLGSASWDDLALTVLARVVGRPAADRVILDCGSKTLTTDLARGFGSHAGYGVVFKSLDETVPDDTLTIERLSEEHANVRVTGQSPLKPGDLVRVAPNHSCVVSNLVDSIWLVSERDVVDRLEIAARGRIA